MRLLAAALAVVAGGCGADRQPASAVPPVDRFQTSVGLEFQYLPGGTFTMGGPDADAQPRHQVTLSPFYVARDPVTVGLFRQFLHDTGRQGNRTELGPDPHGWQFEGPQQWAKLPGGFSPSPTHAAIYQNLVDAHAFADWLSKRESRPFRVITEAQLEYVLRSGEATGDEWYWWMAKQPSAPDVWKVAGYYSTAGPDTVGSMPRLYPATPWGIYLTGLLWTQDNYSKYPSEAQVDPTGPWLGKEGLAVVRRGELWARRAVKSDKPDAGILLVSDVLPTDRRVPPPPPAAPQPLSEAIEPLPEQALDLGGGVSLTLRQVPAGRFTMGRAQRERPWTREWPETTVELTPYWLGTTEVTQAQFRAVTGINPSLVPGDTLPVHSVIMAEMLAFCDLLTARERAAGRLGADEEYRLPTEAEWERAALAGRRTRFAHGDDEQRLAAYAWYDVLGGPRPVATKHPNRWGFFDMQGSILEILCESGYKYSGNPQAQHWMPKTSAWGGWGGVKEWHAARGGAWNMGAVASEPTLRRTVHVNSRTYFMGFRLARGPVLPDPNPGDLRTWLFQFAPYRASQPYAAVMRSAPATWPRPAGWMPLAENPGVDSGK